jgi:transcription termination factor NusA
MMVPIGKLSGVGDVLEERLVGADINTVQELADSTVEELIEIEGIGEKSAAQLIERAREYMAEFEEERRQREEAELAEAEAAAEADVEDESEEDDDEDAEAEEEASSEIKDEASDEDGEESEADKAE